MNLYLIRHTRTSVPSGICYGQTDVGTASTFATETDAICTNLQDIVFTHCFSSPLQRCHQLAGKLVPKKIINTDDRLMELHFGKWEMLPWTEINKQEEAKSWFGDFKHIPCPEGESYEHLQDRIHSFMQELQGLPDDSEVMVVTHGGCIRAFLTLLEGEDPTTTFNHTIDYGDIWKLIYFPCRQ
jgi:alpha-ribazole phosphatase